MRSLVLLALLLPALPGAQAAQAVVLLHHPADRVDPFGVAMAGGGDTFSARYGHLAADVGRFDFPYFVADGVRFVRALPDPAVPYQATLAAYDNATRDRLAHPAPLALEIRAGAEADAVAVRVRVEPAAPLQDPQGEQRLRLWVALSEDAIHYQPPAPVSNGVTEHRFVVRALHDLGPLDLAAGAPAQMNATLPLDPSWRRGNLAAAAWVQADAAPGRFEPHEILNAAQAPMDGVAVRQEGRAVLVEVYSATWCNPCLYGDLAAEQLALRYAGARPLEMEGARYFHGASLAALALAVVAGAALAWWPIGRRA